MKPARLFFAVLLPLALAAACRPTPQALPTATAVPLATAAPARPDTPSEPAASLTPLPFAAPTATPFVLPNLPTETAAAAAFSFQESIHFFEGGGGGGCEPYSRPLPLVDRTTTSTYPNRQEFFACLIGLPEGKLAELSIIDPSGAEIPWLTVRVPYQSIVDPYYQVTYTRVLLPAFVSLALGSPGWQLSARFGSDTVTGRLYDPAKNEWWPDYERAVTHSRFPTGAPANPLDPALRTPYRTGDTIYLQGVHFTPNSDLSLGLYRGAYEMAYVRSFDVRTDSQGSFETSLLIGSEFSDGAYSVIPSEMFFPEDNSSIEGGSFAAFEVRNHVPYEACQDAPVSHLLIGQQALMVDDQANNLRYGVGLAEDVIGKIQPGERVLVMGGPDCLDGYVWWLVYNQTSKIIGWSAEGDEKSPWLSPLP